MGRPERRGGGCHFSGDPCRRTGSGSAASTVAALGGAGLLPSRCMRALYNAFPGGGAGMAAAGVQELPAAQLFWRAALCENCASLAGSVPSGAGGRTMRGEASSIALELSYSSRDPHGVCLKRSECRCRSASRSPRGARMCVGLFGGGGGLRKGSGGEARPPYPWPSPAGISHWLPSQRSLSSSAGSAGSVGSVGSVVDSRWRWRNAVEGVDSSDITQ